MLKTLFLVCAASIPRTDCDRTNARVAMNGPDAPHAAACAMQGKDFYARTALEIRNGENPEIASSPNAGADRLTRADRPAG